MLLTDLQLHLDRYQNFFDSAKKAEAENKFGLAAEYYTEAAKIMHTVFEGTKGDIRNVYRQKRDYCLTRAEQCADAHDRLPRKQPGGPARPGNGGGAPSNGGGNGGNQQQQAEAAEGDEKFKPIDDTGIRFSDVAGLDRVKQEIRDKLINPLKYPDLYKDYGLATGGGIMLYGPPGTGKTMIAKAIAGELGMPFFSVRSSDIVSKWVGDSESNIQELFRAVRSREHAILFVDEMDSLFHIRGGNDTHNDSRVAEFLSQLDGVDTKRGGLLILGATNVPWDVDPAATRPGRFSSKIYIPLPDEEARRYLIKYRMTKIAAPFDHTVNIDELVQETVDMTLGSKGALILVLRYLMR